MINLKKNIWLVFFLVSVTSIVVYISYSVNDWRTTKRDSARYQTTRIRLFADSTSAFFSQLSATFNVFGEHLLQKGEAGDIVDNTPIADSIVNTTPGLKAMAALNMDGSYLAYSSNFTPNHPLRNNNPTEMYHEHALSNNLMIKRSHKSLAHGTTEWVIPFGKFLGKTDSDNAPHIAITAGVVFEATPLFDEKTDGKGFHAYEILRRDSYLQYSIRSVFDDITAPVPEDYYNQITSLNLDESNQVKVVDITKNGVSYLVAIKYSKLLDLWFVSSIPIKEIQREFYKRQAPLLVLLLLGLIVFFKLCNRIEKAQERRLEHIRRQSEYDHITQLPNRTYLRNNLDQWLTKQKSATIYSLEIDNLREINDGFGYAVGDMVLCEVAQRLSDLSLYNALVVREYANRFVVVIAELKEHSYESFGSSLHARLNQPCLLSNTNIPITICMGMTFYPEHGKHFNDIMMVADIALSHSKRNHNNVAPLTSDMISEYQSRVQIGQLLREAINSESPYMVFQPQINRDGEIRSIEALVRWEHEELGFIPPDQFIEIAEMTGQMVELGYLIIRKSLSEFAKIQAEVNSALSLSMNVSVQQLSDKHFVSFLVEELSRNDIQGSAIVLEVTESIFIDDLSFIRPVCRRLAFYGIGLSLDDFGTGYSSLSVLKNFNVNELKIDRSFVMAMFDSDKSSSLVKTILTLSQQLDLISVAEGVETREQHKHLMDFGCDLFQGYYFSKPLRAEYVIPLINDMNADNTC